MLDFPKAGNSQRILSHGCLARLGSMRVRAIRSGQPVRRAHPRPYAALACFTTRDVDERRMWIVVVGCAHRGERYRETRHLFNLVLLSGLIRCALFGVLWWTSKAFGSHRPMPRRTPPTCNAVVETGCPLAPSMASLCGSCACRLWATGKSGTQHNLT